MRSLLAVVLDVCPQDALKVPTPEDEDVIQTLGANGAHEPLGEGVGSRCPNGRSDHPDALAVEHLIERARELRVSVAHEEPDVPEPFPDREVPRLLGDPGGVGSATSGVNAMWSETISRSKPRPSTVCAQLCSTLGLVPGPKFGTFTPIRTGSGYPVITSTGRESSRRSGRSAVDLRVALPGDDDRLLKRVSKIRVLLV